MYIYNIETISNFLRCMNKSYISLRRGKSYILRVEEIYFDPYFITFSEKEKIV